MISAETKHRHTHTQHTHSLNSQMMVSHAHVCPSNCYLRQPTSSHKLYKHIIKPHGSDLRNQPHLHTHTHIHTQTYTNTLAGSCTNSQSRCTAHVHLDIHKYRAWALCFDSVITSGEAEARQSEASSEAQMTVQYSSAHMEIIPTSHCNLPALMLTITKKYSSLRSRRDS